MSRGWLVVLLVGAATVMLKAAGPIILDGRTPSPRVQAALSRLAPATFGALIAISTFTNGRTLTVDARIAALALGLAGAWRRLPSLLVLAAAVASVAAIRRVSS